MPHFPGRISGVTTSALDTESKIMQLSRMLEPRETDTQLVGGILDSLNVISERSSNRQLRKRADMAASLLKNGPDDDM